MKLVNYELVIAAPPGAVFEHFTTIGGLQRWIAAEAAVDPVPGGLLRWTHENGATMLGRFVKLDPPHRLVFTYGWENDLMGLPPESSRVEIDIEDHEAGTLLRLRHYDIPDDVAQEHRHGWIYFLDRLRTVTA